jgi:hypothetical protein
MLKFVILCCLFVGVELDAEEDEDDEEAEAIVLEARFPWEGSDRDYQYEEVGSWNINALTFLSIPITLEIELQLL